MTLSKSVAFAGGFTEFSGSFEITQKAFFIAKQGDQKSKYPPKKHENPKDFLCFSSKILSISRFLLKTFNEITKGNSMELMPTQTYLPVR